MKITISLLSILAPLFLALPTLGQNQQLLASSPQQQAAVLSANQPASFPNLGEYLDKNLEYPELAKRNGVEGAVTVLATIGDKGEITALKLHQGIGFGCDETVMELVSNMPNWRPAVKNGLGVPQKVFIRVRFRLE